MAISDKLNYLIETKQLFKDRLNSLGAEIIESTTFRNYLTWLDTFYNHSSDKTDLAKNGVVGRTSQDGEPTPENPVEINNLSGDVEYKVRGKNLFDKNNITQNKYIDINNEITDGQGWVISDYISVIANETYTYQGLTTVGTAPYSAYYDENKSLINTFKQAVGVNTITIPINACYVRFSIRNNTENHNIDTFMIEKGSTASSYEPYISESFPLSLKSRNLFDYKTPNINQITWAPTDNGGLFTSLTFWRNLGNKLELDTTKQYTFSFGARNSTKLYYYIKTYTDETYNTVKTTIVNDGTALSKTFTPDSKYVSIYFANGGDLQNVEIPNIQLEESQTKTEFEPYYDINLCNSSDYKDRIYSQNGEFYLDKKTSKVVLDGSRNWTKSGNTNIDRFVLSGYVDYGDTNCFSNYFDNGIYSDTNYTKNQIFLNTYSSTKRIIINYSTVGTTTLAQFKTWLSTHNTEAQYVLATPTTEKITQENYPTLYSQLLAIQEFLTKYKINKEFLLDYSSPEIEY